MNENTKVINNPNDGAENDLEEKIVVQLDSGTQFTYTGWYDYQFSKRFLVITDKQGKWIGMFHIDDVEYLVVTPYAQDTSDEDYGCCCECNDETD